MKNKEIIDSLITWPNKSEISDDDQNGPEYKQLRKYQKSSLDYVAQREKSQRLGNCKTQS